MILHQLLSTLDIDFHHVQFDFLPAVPEARQIKLLVNFLPCLPGLEIRSRKHAAVSP
jgi:hypothetical protein